VSAFRPSPAAPILRAQAAGANAIPPPYPRRSIAPPPPLTGPRFDEHIQVPRVRVIDQDGENLGVLYTREALAMAREAGLNLVEISPNADPPVCKILDIGRFKYEAQKKANIARKTQKVAEIKEIKVRPNIDDHDYDVKMRAVRKFIEEGDKVKITLRFRGRELSNAHLGMRLLDRIRADTEAVAKIEQMPRMEGRQMLMVLAPK
jgi:translation initiation factor IF-3